MAGWQEEEEVGPGGGRDRVGRGGSCGWTVELRGSEEEGCSRWGGSGLDLWPLLDPGLIDARFS